MSVSERSRINSEVDGEFAETGMLWYECDMNSLILEIAKQQKSSGECSRRIVAIYPLCV